MYECTFRGQNLYFDWPSHNELRDAIRGKKTDLVRQLINNGAQVNIRTPCSEYFNYSYHSPLHLAVIARSLEITKILLDNGADICDESYGRDSPLTLAAKTNNNAIIDLILSYDIRHYRNADGLSHFHIACMRNRTDVVQKLILSNQGKSINEAVYYDSVMYPRYTALHFAVHFGCVETVDLLLRAGADITAKDLRKSTALHLAHLQRHEEIIDLILASHIYEYTNPKDAQGLSHFHIACTRDNVLVVEHFVKLGININEQVRVDDEMLIGRYAQWNAVIFAMFYECPHVLEYLLRSSRIQLHIPECFSQYLASAFITQNNRIYDLITKTKKSRSHRNFEGHGKLSKLHIACIRNNIEALNRLLNPENIDVNNLNVNAPTKTGSTPLHLAAKYNSEDAVEFLLRNGANPMLQDSRGRTPLHIAFERRNTIVVDKIAKRLTVCSQNLIDDTGLSLFHMLCTTYDGEDGIRNLISSGIDINTPVGENSFCWAGFTPIHFAVEFQVGGIVEFLLKYNPDIYILNKMNSMPLDICVEKLFASRNSSDRRQVASAIFLLIFGFIPFENRWQYNRKMNGLHALCMHREIDRLEGFVSNHPEKINRIIDYPLSRSYHKCTPLHLSIQEQKYAEAKMLLEKGANPLMVNQKGQTALEQVCYNSNQVSDIESLFLNATVIVTQKLSHFHIACALALLNVVKLLDHVPDPNLKMGFVNCLNDRGQTPLHSLFAQNHNERNLEEIAEILVRNGADINARDFELQTPLHHTYDMKIDILQFFVNSGAHVNDQNLYGETILHKILHNYKMFYIDYDYPSPVSAASYDLQSKMILLLESGSDINVIDERGETYLAMMSNLNLSDNLFSLRDCAIVLLKHVKKLSFIGFSICQTNKRAYVLILQKFDGIFDEASFLNACKSELELMRSTSVDNLTTVHDILLKNVNGMTSHCEDIEIQAIINSSAFIEKFPIYGSVIRLQIKRGSVRRPLLRRCVKAIKNVIGKPLPLVCIDMILQELSNTDLNNLISS
ncbi:hypothetical protein QAD02_015940 [Eretmocerus hayati]|uniref:Uncharacterized protein n=1 Tax=Eretmocerus hayati TaxID=131215 RepID=A0ACC2P9N3_9HYME|nr:hypothetical protein QAD02_015940 [Eretmocerus hayati]